MLLIPVWGAAQCRNKHIFMHSLQSSVPLVNIYGGLVNVKSREAVFTHSAPFNLCSLDLKRKVRKHKRHVDSLITGNKPENRVPAASWRKLWLKFLEVCFKGQTSKETQTY